LFESEFNYAFSYLSLGDRLPNSLKVCIFVFKIALVVKKYNFIVLILSRYFDQR